MLKATRLSLRYNTVEDRLVLLATSADQQVVALWLTRRMSLGILSDLPRVLEASSPVARRAPSELRADALLLEHQGALLSAVKTPHGAAFEGDKRIVTLSPGSAELVRTIEITTVPKGFHVTIKGEKPLVWFHASRKEIHRFLGRVTSVAEAASWDIQPSSGWMAGGRQAVSIN